MLPAFSWKTILSSCAAISSRPVALVLLEGELGVLDAALEHPLVAGGDLLRPGRVAVGHVEEPVRKSALSSTSGK